MKVAIEEAKKAFNEGEVPVGAVLVKNNEIILKAHNQSQQQKSAIKHAELILIELYNHHFQEKYLIDCTLYVTLEPCIMCTGALLWSKLPRLVFGALDPKIGACGTKYNLTDAEKSNHQIEVISGICEKECEELLSSFFTSLRD